MKEKTIQFDKLSLQFTIEDDIWQLKLPKSQTRIKDVRQMGVMIEAPEFFVPVKVSDEADLFTFSFFVDRERKQWKDVLKLNRNEKLRLLCNVSRFEKGLSTRVTFFLHPDNLVFDDNLMPLAVYRGIRGLVPPFDVDEAGFLKQLKCLAIALLSKKYTFDELYYGSLQNAKDTEFERQVNEINDLTQLIAFLEESYRAEQKKTEKNMQIVPIKRFRLFKQLAIIMIAVSVLLAAPLVYYGFVKVPYQEELLAAHDEYLASDYGEVIHTLEDTDAEKLPDATKYILAYSYISVEDLSEQEKEVIMKNVSLKSDKNYLLYWIYNGRGDFDESVEKAKYIDDPQLIMYALIKKIEQAKNNPDLTGTERDEKVSKLQDELNKYQEEYDLLPEEEATSNDPTNEAQDMQEENLEEGNTEENPDQTNSDKENTQQQKDKKDDEKKKKD
ncbi:type VII secretion protein EssB [Virgibacillus dakarensis]|nr:type VII secretion protein EssB [Virgibacillus dakarensis]